MLSLVLRCHGVKISRSCYYKWKRKFNALIVAVVFRQVVEGHFMYKVTELFIDSCVFRCVSVLDFEDQCPDCS